MKAAEPGFGLVEWLVAMALSLVVAGTLIGLVRLSGEVVRTSGAQAEVDQRLRMLVDRTVRVVASAGAGASSGPMSGALAEWMPAVFPHRRGVRDSDPELSAFDDRITVVGVMAGAGDTSLAESMASAQAPLVLTSGAGCPVGRPACGLAPGEKGLVADDTGRFDLFTVSAVAGDAITSYTPLTLSHAYSSSDPTLVARADVAALLFDAPSGQVRAYQGNSAGLPLVDRVAALRIRYYGDPAPPRWPRPSPGRSSCVIDETGAPRLPALVPTDGSLVELTRAMLSDGPVCGAAPQRFDADLYRLRMVRVTLSLDPEPDARRPGVSQVARREVTFDVALRNLPR